MRFTNEERLLSLILQADSPMWWFVERICNPDLPDGTSLHNRSVLGAENALDSSATQQNLMLLRMLRLCIQSNIQILDKVLPIEQVKNIKHVHKRSKLFDWIKNATDCELGLVSACSFCLFKPYDEKGILEKLQCPNFEPSQTLSNDEKRLAELYWLTVWKAATTSPLNTELLFGFSPELVSALNGLDIEKLLLFITDESACRFQLRHTDVLLNLLNQFVEQEKTTAVLRFLQDYRMLQEQDERLALGYEGGLPLEDDYLLVTRLGERAKSSSFHAPKDGEITQLLERGRSENDVAQTLGINVNEVRFARGRQLRSTFASLNFDRQKRDCIDRLVQLFLFSQLMLLGIRFSWFQRFWTRAVGRSPISEYQLKKHWGEFLNLGLARIALPGFTRHPVSSTHTYRTLFPTHEQRIMASAFVILYNRIGTKQTKHHHSLRNMQVAILKMQNMFDKTHYRTLSLVPITAPQAFFLAEEWRYQRIALNYCSKCGHIYASPTFSDNQTVTSTTFSKRMSNCPFCEFLSHSDNFDTKLICDEVRKALITPYENFDR